jgi:hypothetical protein
MTADLTAERALEGAAQRAGDVAAAAGRQAEDAVEEAKPWVVRLGRFGFAAKGIVYGIVGILAVEAAAGLGGATTDTRGAIGRLVQAPLGRAWLAAIGVGLIGYVLWRFVQAALDTDNQGTDLRGIAIRGSYAVIALTYAGLALYALRLSFGGTATGESSATQDWTAKLMSQPLGQWLVASAGLVVIGIGVGQLWQAWTASFCKRLRLHEMTETQQQWVVRAGRLGSAARGIVFGVIGVFLIVAAYHASPGEARGLSGALATLAEQPFGIWLLGLVGAGLVAYGAFMLVQARFRRMYIR